MLPNDIGSGASSGSSWAAGVFDAVRGAAADVVTEFSSFTVFRKHVDQLIHDLRDSDAGPGRGGQEQLVRRQFGGGGGQWAEAAGLFTAYQTVVGELETLSKLLSDSMEGMNIAVLASHKGYRNIDLDVRDRMTAISTETTKHYGGTYDPDPRFPKKPPTTAGVDAGGTI
ncbi:hypothetical protein [Streptomyces sp. MBT65]|uniref:hypothetical protein n=1 Tax=Streptomyces sp. MBT65 TaxID=1488395 RepID=UPI0027DA08B5|nr:hypothetical protein [Streptomyces sp. MBT65]